MAGDNPLIGWFVLVSYSDGVMTSHSKTGQVFQAAQHATAYWVETVVSFKKRQSGVDAIPGIRHSMGDGPSPSISLSTAGTG